MMGDVNSYNDLTLEMKKKRESKRFENRPQIEHPLDLHKLVISRNKTVLDGSSLVLPQGREPSRTSLFSHDPTCIDDETVVFVV